LYGKQVDVFTTSEPQILFLGTSSTKPTSFRGCSAIYYFTQQGAVLMDCGEGTYGQLFDHFGDQKKVNEVLCKTVCIFVTHYHGDHCSGVQAML